MSSVRSSDADRKNLGEKIHEGNGNGKAHKHDQAVADELVAWTKAIFAVPGCNIEVRPLPTESDIRIFRGDDVAGLGRDVRRLGPKKGTYATLNPVNGDKTTGSASDHDISHRRYLLIDVDPTRPSGVSATEAEKEIAGEVIDAIARWLKLLGFPDPILADSGNGFHLLYAIDLPNDDESTDLIRECLRAVSAKFSVEGAKVDTSVFNASRIVKLYGTLSAKGENTPERPHRYSRVLSCPDRVEVPRDLLVALAATAPFEIPVQSEPIVIKLKKHKDRPAGDVSPGDDFNARMDLVELMRQYGCTINRTTAKGVTVGTRPGKDPKAGDSFTINGMGTGTLKNFSDNFAGLPTIGTFDAFGVYARLSHAGDFSAATKALAAAGYGSQAKHQGDGGSGKAKSKKGQDDKPNFDRSDAGNACRLVKRFGDRIRYCYAWKSWFWWDRSRWVRDCTGQIVRYAKKAVQEIGAEAAKITDSDEWGKMLKWALASQSRKSIEAMIFLAQSEAGIPVKPEEWDEDKWLLNCTNGTLDLQTGKLREHNRLDLITKLCPVAFDLNARCPRWEKFEKEIFASDMDLVGYMNRVLGYAITADNSVHEMYILYGDGSNGKNSFLDTIRNILGDYACVADPSLLLNSKHESHPTGISRPTGPEIRLRQRDR